MPNGIYSDSQRKNKLENRKNRILSGDLDGWMCRDVMYTDTFLSMQISITPAWIVVVALSSCAACANGPSLSKVALPINVKNVLSLWRGSEKALCIPIRRFYSENRIRFQSDSSQRMQIGLRHRAITIRASEMEFCLFNFFEGNLFLVTVDVRICNWIVLCKNR